MKISKKRIISSTIILGFISAYYGEETTNNANNILASFITIALSFLMTMISLLIFPNLTAQVYDKSNVTDEEEEFLNEEEFEETIKETEEKESYEDKIFDNEDFE